MAIGQNAGTAITAILPALIAVAVPPGTQHIPLIVGTITLTVCVIGALGAPDPQRLAALDQMPRCRRARRVDGAARARAVRRGRT